MTKFCWCTLLVSDMERSIKFYTEVAGLRVDRRFPAGPGKEVCFLGDGETKVELIRDAACPGSPAADSVTLGFEAGPLEAKLAFLKGRGIEPLGPVIQPNPGVRFFFIKDPDGFRVQFVERPGAGA